MCIRDRQSTWDSGPLFENSRSETKINAVGDEIGKALVNKTYMRGASIMGPGLDLTGSRTSETPKNDLLSRGNMSFTGATGTSSLMPPTSSSSSFAGLSSPGGINSLLYPTRKY
eukprot:TRINITY_DN9158_c0_g1_i5.p2 TRINITY_DN9158_c0_g1~~TRINITY_DN9158_c0_g1_i5.p2  ORF type:complete len:114 (+),score=23.30 TRINITY_DN9158_c0_g1_i5:2-343(+)